MNAPPPYVGQPGASGQSQQSASGFLFMDIGYIKRPSGGVLKIIEMVLCMVVIICNNVELFWQPLGGGWVNFVVIIAIFGAAFTLFVNMYDLPSKMIAAGTYRLGELIYHISWTVLWLIAGIVAAARAGEYSKSSIAACAVFSFLTLVVFAVDSYFAHVAWRQGGHASDGSAPYNNFPDSQQGTMNVGGLAPPPNTSAASSAAAGFPYSSQPGAGTTSGYSGSYSEKPVY